MNVKSAPNREDIRGISQKEYWDMRASEYDAQYGQYTPTTRMKVARKVSMMFKYGNVCHTDRVLEIGCGTGAYTGEIALRLKTTLLAVDIAPQMITKAKRDWVDVDFELADARELWMGDEEFDVVITAFLLQHVDTNLVVPEIHRVLKPNGKLIALVPNILNPIHYLRAKGFFNETSISVDFNRWKWESLLHDWGFSDVSISPVEFTSPYVPERFAKEAMNISSILERIPLIREFAGSLLIVAQKG